ncbi:MAG: fumarate hydratase C-terminal domain-containing protein, partial [Candidatus Fimenecus sp.]
MAEYTLNTSEIKDFAEKLRAGDRVLLSGTVYTSRDAAHKRIKSLIDSGKELPYNLNGAAIYYAGPTPTPEGLAIGSCGPTTSGRMDKFAPEFLDLGLSAMIGKGPRTKD